MGFKPKARKAKANDLAKEMKRLEWIAKMDREDAEEERGVRHSQFERYYTMLKERGPFDVDFFPDNMIYGMIRPYYKDAEQREYRPPINMCVQHAIDFARKQKKMALEYPKVYRAHFELDVDYIFYISFKATDKKSGIQKHYETKIALTADNFFTLKKGEGKMKKTKRKPEPKCPASVRLIRVKRHQLENSDLKPYC